MALPLEDYALLSDCHSAALVGKNGSIDWLSFPCFDSAASFASLLGTEKNGYWQISPQDNYSSTRRYIEHTMILETTFETDSGKCRLLDCMPYGERDPSLIRIVEGISGTVKLKMEYLPCFDYGRISPWLLSEGERTMLAIGGPDALVLYSSEKIKRCDAKVISHFEALPGDSKTFTVMWYQSHLNVPKRNCLEKDLIERTYHFWKNWRGSCCYTGLDHDSVKNSLMVLKALTYKPTGAIIAAPTTSLPERIGGSRNWDYRFSWIRDSSFTLMALLKAGYREEATEWRNWLLRAVAGNPGETNIMYGIRGERRLDELELDWLPGYENSRPVRIGNAAHTQFQLDVYGELLSAYLIGRQAGIPVSERAWMIEKSIINYLTKHWEDPDEGIWEVRSGRKQFTHSKLMAWQALSCAVQNVKLFNLDGDLEKWTILRDKIHRDICQNGYNEKLNTFVQTYHSNELDASLLMMAKIGFLPGSDKRIQGTVKAIQKNLTEGGLIKRYRTETNVDGIQEKEGCFIPCTFWLVDNLRIMGKIDEAKELYYFTQTLKNDVGLYSEEYSVNEKRLIGNFPQGFSHIAHAISAMGFENEIDI